MEGQPAHRLGAAGGDPRSCQTEELEGAERRGLGYHSLSVRWPQELGERPWVGEETVSGDGDPTLISEGDVEGQSLGLGGAAGGQRRPAAEVHYC